MRYRKVRKTSARRGIFLRGLLCLWGLASLGWSEDFWTTKPTGEWSREETQLFFRNSPWTRQIVFEGSVLIPQAPGGTADDREGRGVLPGAERRIGSSTTEVTPIEPRRGTPYFIEWSSAKIVRQATSHFRALQGQKTEDETERFSSAFYLLSVAGPDLKSFEGLTETQLKTAAYLRPRRAKAKLEPTEVRVRKSEDGRIIVVQFAFPRQKDGQPAIPDLEKAVEFYCRVRDVVLRTSFNLLKMTIGQGRDL